MTISIENHPNNLRLKQIVESKRLSLPVALTIFNRGRPESVTESVWKSWLADPQAQAWRELDSSDLAHAERVFALIR